MACDCFTSTNELLANHNTKLLASIYFGTADKPGYVTPTLMSEKIIPRNRQRVTMSLTYCPFCGTRYAPGAEND